MKVISSVLFNVQNYCSQQELEYISMHDGICIKTNNDPNLELKRIENYIKEFSTQATLQKLNDSTVRIIKSTKSSWCFIVISDN